MGRNANTMATEASASAAPTDNFVAQDPNILLDETGQPILDEYGNPKRKPPVKLVKQRDAFADLKYERARLRCAETKQLLFHAVKTGNESELVRILDRDHDADIHVTNCSGATLLHVASAMGSVSMIVLLLDRAQRINEERGAADTPLIDVRENMKSGGFTALHHAAIHGHARALTTLCKRGANMNAQDEDGFTPLHHACRRGNGEIVEALLHEGADPQVRDKDGKLPSYVAELFKHDAIVAILPKEDKAYFYQSYLCV